MADNSLNNIDVFNDKDFLDVAVEGYEENVPLLGQIGIGVTPVGVGIDLAESVKYGRQGLGELSAGLGALSSPFQWHKSGPLLSSGAKNIGIAGLATIGAIPVVGDIVKKRGKDLIKGLDASKADDIVPISSIEKVTDETGKIVKSPKTRVDQAEELLETSTSGFSYKGVTQPKRQPIEVIVKDGSLEQIGGKSTLEALERAGVEEVPIKKFNTYDDYADTEYVRKANKEAKRLEDAKKLVPTVGNPTFEAPVRHFGKKMEKALDMQMNLHQNYIQSIDEMFDIAKRATPSFQKEVDDVAGQFRLTVTRNPGESLIGEIDETTGFAVGIVKTPESIARKISAKYNDDITQLTDGIRARIIVESTEEADEVAEEFARRYAVKDSGNQVNQFGYRDRKLNLKYTNPETGEQIIAEVGLVPQAMQEAAEEAHRFYEPWRDITGKYKTGEMPFHLQAYAAILKDRQKFIFNKAYEFIDTSWKADDIVKKFAFGGAVYGSSGSVSPITPNSPSNSSLVNLMPSTPISPYWTPDALDQELSPTGIKKALETPSSGNSFITAGPRSQEKNNSAINDSITKKFVDLPTEGGRKEIL